jgi:uncharacterized protein YlxW (UPF0749 family)
MTENDIFMALYAVCIVAMALLFVIANVILDRLKQARADRAKERARESDLYARWQRMHEPPLDYEKLQAELDAEFATLESKRSA